MQRHIFLIGMPGCGKSALGRRVAQKLHIPYLDTDTYLTEKTGMDTSQLSVLFGSDAYRDAETRLLQELAGAMPGMISTGGGMCLRPENRRLMKNHGVIVLIDRPLDETIQDYRAEKRPYLANASHDEIENLYNDRMPIYREAADIVMDNGKGFHYGLSALESIARYYL